MIFGAPAGQEVRWETQGAFLELLKSFLSVLRSLTKAPSAFQNTCLERRNVHIGPFENKASLFCESVIYFCRLWESVASFLMMWRQFSFKNKDRTATGAKADTMDTSSSLCTPSSSIYFHSMFSICKLHLLKSHLLPEGSQDCMDSVTDSTSVLPAHLESLGWKARDFSSLGSSWLQLWLVIVIPSDCLAEWIIAVSS